MSSKNPLPVNDVKLTDVLDVVVRGYVVNYWHSSNPYVLQSKKFHTKRALMYWIEKHKDVLIFSGKPVFTIETIMMVAEKPVELIEAINFK